MVPIHRKFILEPQSRAASQQKQLPVSAYGSLCASQRELHQCRDVAECLEVWRLWIGGLQRLQNGVIPDGPSRRFHKISLFPLLLGQPWHYSALSQKGLATADGVLCREEQRQVEAADRTSKGVDATTAHQDKPHQAICHCSSQGVSSFQVPPSSFSKAVRGKGQSWYLYLTADQEDDRMWRVRQAAEQKAENGLEQFCSICSWLPG